MRVSIDQRIYEMNREQYRATLRFAKAEVKHGIYAIEKCDVCILQNRKIESPFYLRQQVKRLEEKGYKVHWNK